MELTKDFSVEITKKRKLLEVSNDKCHNWYYLFYGRIYNADKTRMRKFKFVLWFDVFDLQEFYEGQEKITTADIGRYVDELGWSTCSSNEYLIKSYNDCTDFYDWCNETINDYNGKR